MSDEEPLLLDTHCWIWLQLGDLEKFSQGTIEQIRRSGATGMLRVSAISVWEIAMLESKGRIRIHMDCLEWVRRALETVPLSPEIAVESNRLPGSPHGDPADRILIATARNLGARLMTRDQALLDYGRDRHARIVSA